MADFSFLQNPLSKQWVILAPRRAKRPNIAKGSEPVCPFCPGKEGLEKEVYRISSKGAEETDEPKETNGAKTFGTFVSSDPSVLSNWLVRVIPNKFPFAPIHEVIIHSPDHHKNFDELALSQVELILRTYRQRYLTYQDKGQVYIFHNKGEKGGESLPHPHSQLAVVPEEVRMQIPRLDPNATVGTAPEPNSIATQQQASTQGPVTMVASTHFYLFCPQTSQWPDEVWIAPKKRGRAYGETTDEEISDLAFVLQRTIQIFDLRHGQEFPFNFYIYPGGDWYLRIIPRIKTLGGFELGTGVYVNTQDPSETLEFIKTHFHNPQKERILAEHQADYNKAV